MHRWKRVAQIHDDRIVDKLTIKSMEVDGGKIYRFEDVVEIAHEYERTYFDVRASYVFVPDKPSRGSVYLTNPGPTFTPPPKRPRPRMTPPLGSTPMRG